MKKIFTLMAALMLTFSVAQAQEKLQYMVIKAGNVTSTVKVDHVQEITFAVIEPQQMQFIVNGEVIPVTSAGYKYDESYDGYSFIFNLDESETGTSYEYFVIDIAGQFLGKTIDLTDDAYMKGEDGWYTGCYTVGEMRRINWWMDEYDFTAGSLFVEKTDDALTVEMDASSIGQTIFLKYNGPCPNLDTMPAPKKARRNR